MDNPFTLSTGDDSSPQDMDLASDVVGGDSCVVTLEAFSPSVDLSARGARSSKNVRNRRSKKAVKNNDNRSIQVAPGIFEPNDYDKYLTVVLDDAEADIFDVH